MIRLELSHNRLAKVWIGQVPDLLLESSDVLARSVRATTGEEGTRSVAVELFIPLGGFAMYGTLGATYEPKALSELLIEVLVAEQGASYSSELAVSDKTSVSLPRETATVVLKAATKLQQESTLLAGGTLTFDRAIHGIIGSSPAVFVALTHACFELLGDPTSCTDATGIETKLITAVARALVPDHG